MNKYDDEKNVPGDVNTYIGAPGGGYDDSSNGNGYHNGDIEKHAPVPVHNGHILVDAPSECRVYRAQRARPAVHLSLSSHPISFLLSLRSHILAGHTTTFAA